MYVPSARHHALDGLRAIAILAVLIGHAFPRLFPHGHLGVDVFFALSGYLITGLLWDRAPFTLGAITAFWRRRFWRLAPALGVVVLASLAIAWVVQDPKETGITVLSAAGALSWTAPLLLPLTGGYFAPEIATNPLLHTWSLGVEMQFYLVFPFVVWVVFGRPKTAMLVFGALALASLAHAWGLYGIQSPWAHYSPLTRAWQLLAGAMLAVHIRHHASAPCPWLGMGALAVLMLTLLAPALYGWGMGVHILAVATTVVLIRHAPDATHVGRLLRAAPLQALGLASYSVYLWHQPIMATTRLMMPDGTLLFFATTVPAAIVMGALSARFIERPAARVSMGRMLTLGVALVAAFVGGTVLLATIGTQGFAGRYAAAPAQLHLDDPRIGASQRCGYPTTPDGTGLDFCLFPGTGGGQGPTIAVWGDSFAMALTSGFLALKDRPDVLHLGMDGCPLQIGDGWSEGWRRCQWRHESALARIVGDDTITTVVLMSRWEIPQAAHGKERLLAGLSRALDTLAAAGKTVVFAQSPPAYDRDIGAAALRSWRLGVNTLPIQTLDAHLHWPTRAHMEAERMAQGRGIAVIGSLDLLCGATLCPPMRGGTPLYYDDEHLTPQGAAPLAARIRDHLSSRP